MSLKRKKGVGAIFVIAAIATLLAAAPEPGSSRLVSVRQLPEEMAQMCAWDEGGANAAAGPNQIASMEPQNLFAWMQFAAVPQGRVQLPPAVNEVTREPQFRALADTYPTYTSVAVNLDTDEVLLQDNNLWSTRVFNRLDNTPPRAAMTQPKRIIQGLKSHIQYNNGIYIDPNNGDIYSVESDTGDRMVVFARDAQGDVVPKRELHTIHRAYAMTIDEEKQELYITVEYPPKILVYRKEAADDEQPIRVIKGDHTGLETPHGIAIDKKNHLLYVDNWGQAVSFDGSETMNGCCRNQVYETGNLGTAAFHLPSITVYPMDASGDTPPLRVIQGDRTQMNWPSNLSVDQDSGDLYVANDVNQSVLVFTGMTYQRGNVPPARVIKGDKTGLTNPTGVFVDTKHQELWVSNLGNSSATVYPLKADGNVPPLRIIRSGPKEHVSLTFGRTAAVAYDPNREEILVPN
jgi:6-phosphogluconolactonase (cycloisomerase 2 family)